MDVKLPAAARAQKREHFFSRIVIFDAAKNRCVKAEN
jgi:hypothetical protein